MSRPPRPRAATPALRALTQSGIEVRLHEFTHDPAVRDYGTEAVRALGVEPGRVFKTLVVTTGEGTATSPALAVIPVPRSLDLKAVAAHLGAKKAAMADPALAERLTGYVLGGISPLGCRTRLRTVLDESALDHDTILVSGGRRGLDVELAPRDLLTLTRAHTARIAKD